MRTNIFSIAIMMVFSLALFTQCDKENDEFTIDDLIGSYNFNGTETYSYNSETTVSDLNEIVTINKTSSEYTLSSNQLVARGLDRSNTEFVLDITGDAFIIVEPSYVYNGSGTINNNGSSIDISFYIQEYSYEGVATKR